MNFLLQGSCLSSSCKKTYFPRERSLILPMTAAARTTWRAHSSIAKSRPRVHPVRRARVRERLGSRTDWRREREAPGFLAFCCSGFLRLYCKLHLTEKMNQFWFQLLLADRRITPGRTGMVARQKLRLSKLSFLAVQSSAPQPSNHCRMLR